MSIESLKADSCSLDLSMTAKAGYDSNKAWVGSLEWAAGLSLDNGISCRSDLTLGTNAGAKFGMNVSLSR